MKAKKIERVIHPVRYFSDEFKKRRVEEIEKNLVSVAQVSQAYSVSRTAVYNWIYQYSNHLKKGIKQVVEMESEAQRIKALQSRIAELERLVGKKQIEVEYLNKLIELTSENLGYDIKKKAGTKLYPGSKKTNQKGKLP